MRPRLRPHVQITRQHYRGRRWHVVHDPSSNHFYRLSAVGHEFVGLLDGRRTVEEVWQLGLTRHGDEALTQNEVIQLLSQLYQSNLISGDINPETDQLLRRSSERTRKKAIQQAIGLMYFKVRLFNPDRILGWIEPLLRPLLNPVGLLLWAALVIGGLAQVVPNWDRAVSGVDGAIAPANWPLMLAVFVVVKLIHELGHGVLCKRFGGHVPEFGVMMLVLLPAPYVDASASWSFASKWRRMAVGAGGMIFELTVASVAAFIWARTEGGLLNQLAYNAMFTASISTLLFNANPLMRFDGYYMLSDLLEVPNLQQRSFAMINFLFQRFFYGLKDAQAPTTSPSEAFVLLSYGVLAGCYRIFLFFSITLYVMGKMFGIGLLLAIWTSAMWFMLPVGKFVHWLGTSPQLSDRRPRAILSSLLLIAAILCGVGLVPAPDRRRAVGVVEAETRTGVFIGAPGFVVQVHVRAGERVEKDQAIVTLENPALLAQLRMNEARLLEMAAREAQETARNPAAAQIARSYIQTIEEQASYLRERTGRLVVRAPHAGVIAGDDPARMLGTMVREGEPLCEVIEPSQIRVTATLDQKEGSWLFELPLSEYDVEVRAASGVRSVIGGTVRRVFDAGQVELPHAALSFSGGGTIATRSDDKSGRIAQAPMFKAWIDLDERTQVRDGDPALLPGERVNLRFSLPRKALLAQWTDRLRKLTQGRARV